MAQRIWAEFLLPNTLLFFNGTLNLWLKKKATLKNSTPHPMETLDFKNQLTFCNKIWPIKHLNISICWLPSSNPFVKLNTDGNVLGNPGQAGTGRWVDSRLKWN